MMLSRQILRPAAQGVSRSALFSSTTQVLNKVPSPAMDTPENKPDSISSGNDKPKDLNLDNQSPKDNVSNDELKAQAEHARTDKVKNDGIYKRTGQ
ncbi:hypothetical protein QFC22_003210 [Naganishia vaughanmartiniae]|uniref:Uncharacterized protein n=1 Tax=Naganishia vaughanmartiniae TaxID=1424756 RepID=A0ACC2X880_9TREE|nr:hypothetical protein QFC22_003210 [Naganishia vaughanmartiniae]